MNNNLVAPDYDREEAQKKILKMIPCEEEFKRMMDLCPRDYEDILKEKLEFPYSQSEIIEMTKEEYKAAFTNWERKIKEDCENFSYSYDKFVQWNKNCILNLCEDELEHLDWLCEWIAKGRVRNVDMESCGEFSTEGIYFNKDKKLVIFNGR
jgi:hypothetical protein